MICERCKSENIELVTTDKSRHFISVFRCKDCGEVRLPTAKERDDWQ
jgi:hypothetical protein